MLVRRWSQLFNSNSLMLNCSECNTHVVLPFGTTPTHRRLVQQLRRPSALFFNRLNDESKARPNSTSHATDRLAMCLIACARTHARSPTSKLQRWGSLCKANARSLGRVLPCLDSGLRVRQCDVHSFAPGTLRRVMMPRHSNFALRSDRLLNATDLSCPRTATKYSRVCSLERL